MSFVSLIDQLREIPLESILAYHGLAPKPEGTTVRYKNDQFNIVTSEGGLWFDNKASVGGRGAIDLVIRIKLQANPRTASKQNFSDAVRWLSTFQPSAGDVSVNAPSASSPRQPKESFASQAARLATRDDARWPLARNYLLHTRRLPSDLVDNVYHSGDIFASFSQSRPEQTGVCFLHRNLAGEVRGATVRAAADVPYPHLSIGEKQAAWFSVGGTGPGQADQAVVVESAIDALSYLALKRPERTVVISVSGAHVYSAALQAAHDRGWHLQVGLNNDEAGEFGWDRCRETCGLVYPDDPQPTRTLPVRNDWNKDLQAAPRRSQGRRL